MKKLEYLLKKTSNLLNGLSCFSLFVLMLLVTLNVIFRKIFNSPILGTYDYSGFLTIIVIGAGLAFCSIENGHIEIEYFVGKMSAGIQKIIVTFGRLFSFVFLSIYTYALITLGGRLFLANEVSVTTKTPVFIFVYFLAFCFLVFSLTVLIKIFISTKEGEKNES